MKNLIDFLEKNGIGTYKEDVKLTKLSTFKAGGTCPLVIFPDSVDHLSSLIKHLKEHSIPYKVIGNGSNIIFNDGILDLVLIKLDDLNERKVEGTKVVVGSGYSLMKLALELSKKGFSGLEFATGIPGTVGGSVYMNAGAYKADMSEIVKEIKVLDKEGNVITLQNKDLNFQYRHSLLQESKDYICLEATLELKQGDISSILALIEDRKQRRLSSQPWDYPSCGSVFRNPENDFAGRLIEECGLKGYRIGDAMVSEKHANFIINVGKAKGNDIRKLIYYIYDEVYQRFNIKLKIEQEFVGWD